MIIRKIGYEADSIEMVYHQMYTIYVHIDFKTSYDIKYKNIHNDVFL